MTAYVYITGGPFNGGERRVRKFTKTGTLVATYTDAAGDFAGGDTNGDESFVFVADPTNGVVHKFDSSLGLLADIGGGTLAASATNGPTDVCVIGSRLFVVQVSPARIFEFDFSGMLVATHTPALGAPRYLDIQLDDDTVYHQRSGLNDVDSFVLSTAAEDTEGYGGGGGVRVDQGGISVAAGPVVYFTANDASLVAVPNVGGSENYYIDGGDTGIWGFALDPEDFTKAWLVRQTVADSPVHQIDLTQPTGVWPSYTTFQWNANSDTTTDGWLFMRRRVASAITYRPRMRGRHVPHAIRIRGRERGVPPDVPRMRGRQAT